MPRRALSLVLIVAASATLAAGDYALRLASADAQVFVAIVHDECEPDYRNFDRTDLIGLAPAERRALIERAFHEIAREIGGACPALAPPALSLEAMPDIAILSPGTDLSGPQAAKARMEAPR